MSYVVHNANLRNLSSLPLINKSGPRKFGRTPPNEPSSKKNKNKNLKQLPQVYPQEKEGLKKKSSQIGNSPSVPSRKQKSQKKSFKL